MFFLTDDAPEPPVLSQFMQFLKADMAFCEQWEKENPQQGDLQAHNARFRAAYAEFLTSVKTTYALTDADIKCWLG